MKIDSEHLEILAAVVAQGGLTEGATAIGKSQPSVSRTMALLEARVGLPLFEPGRRPLRATELGRRLATLGTRIHELNRDASSLIDGALQGRLGRLRLAGTPIFMDGVISRVIGEFQVRNPDIVLELGYGYREDLLTQLRNATLDLAIVPLRADHMPKDMEFTPLFPGRNVIACRTGHPLTRTKAITAEELKTYRWIAPPKESPLFRDIERALEGFGLDHMPVAFSGGTFASIVGVLTGSDALTVLPASVVLMAAPTTGIASLPLRIEHPDRQLGMLSLADADASMKRLKDFLAAQGAWIDIKLRHGRNAQPRQSVT